MSGTVSFPGDLTVGGNLRVNGVIQPAKAKDDILAIASLQAFPIPLTSFRVFDAMESLLPNPGLVDDLGIYYGTHGTDTPSLRTEDLKAAGSAQVSYARALVQLPWNYVAASSVTLRFMAGMITTVADQSPGGTLDISVYKQQDDPDDAIGSDLAAAAVADNMNALAFVAIDFAITAAGLSPGDILDVKINTSIDDNGTGTAVIGGISWAHLLCNVR